MTETTTTQTITLPAMFYEDHVCRDLPGGKVIKQSKRTVTVELTPSEWSEILSDARYYSNADYFDPEMRSVCRSAQATVRRMTK